MNNMFDLCLYILPTAKLYDDEMIKVITISDLHDYTKNKVSAVKLANEIVERKPHHVIIAGDVLQGKKWESKEALEELKEFLLIISNVCPVIISQGDYDLIGTNDKNRELRNENFKNLEKYNPNKIFSLINDKIEIDKFEILGYTPLRYLISDESIQDHGYAHDKFIEEYMKNGIKPTKDTKKIIEFAGHNPNLIAKSENDIGLETLSLVDTFYSGHHHNGYLKSSLIKNDSSLYLDNGYSKKCIIRDKDNNIIKINPIIGDTDLCRGVLYIDESCDKILLRLRNGSLYRNINAGVNMTEWKHTENEDAIKQIIDNNLKAIVISGGINKYYGLNIPGDKPEITEITYVGKKKRLSLKNESTR